jgi:hypothetical protein
MPARRFEDLVAYQFSVELKEQIRESDCRSALAWAVRCREVTGKLLASQRRQIERDREARRSAGIPASRALEATRPHFKRFSHPYFRRFSHPYLRRLSRPLFCLVSHCHSFVAHSRTPAHEGRDFRIALAKSAEIQDLRTS